jgi:hypothetical protein
VYNVVKNKGVLNMNNLKQYNKELKRLFNTMNKENKCLSW